jgi:glycosyltransferase 2 family protein
MSPDTNKRRFSGPRWITLAGWLISAAALAYVLARVRFSELAKEVRGITWWLIGLAIVVEILPRLLEAARWQYLLRPIKIRLRRLFDAVYVGTLYSGILPLSGGDVVRAVIVARQSRISLTRVLSTELIERVSDALAIILLVWFTLRGLTLPYGLRIGLAVMEVGVGIAVAAGLFLAARQQNLRGHLNRWQPHLKIVVRLRMIALELVEAAERMSVSKMLVSVGAALAAAAVNVTAYWLILHAYHIQLSWLHAAAVFTIVMIGTFLPNAPGNTGTWQFFCAVALQLFGVSAARAAGYSLVAFFVWTIPPVLMGVVALSVSPFKWSDLRAEHPEQAARTLDAGKLAGMSGLADGTTADRRVHSSQPPRAGLMRRRTERRQAGGGEDKPEEAGADATKARL